MYVQEELSQDSTIKSTQNSSEIPSDYLKNQFFDEPPESCSDAAEWWLDFGFQVVPLDPATKKTAVRWQPWLDNLSTESIHKHWKRNPDHELGVILDDSLFMLDADSDAARTALYDLEKHLDVEPALIVKTTKGVHHYYKRAAGTYAHMTSFSTEHDPGKLDVRTARTQTEGRSIGVLPPSSGKEIELIEAASTPDLPEVDQDFIDAVFKHNGQEPPRPVEPKQRTEMEKTVSTGETAEIMSYISPDIGYDEWFRVLAGVHDKFNGSEEGLILVDQWSSGGKDYPGFEQIEYKWRGFTHGKGITFSTVAKMAEGNGADLAEIARKYKKNGNEFADPIITDMNRKHAVMMINGQCLIMTEITDLVFGKPDISLSKVPDFNHFYNNKRIQDPENPKNMITVSKYWLRHPDRREYRGIVFEPGGNAPADAYNLWRGLAVKPEKGDWSLFKQHIWEVIAKQRKERYTWIMAWLARIVQDPGGQRPGVALVLRGAQGTGKGVFINTFGKLLGRHFVQIAQANQITGRFNSHLKDALLAFVDEGFWAGDKQAEGALKNLITEPTLAIEQKGKDIIRVKNHLNLVIASNNDWVIPAGPDERRHYVIDVSEKYKQDHSYFKTIMDQMNNSGLEAMLHDLLEWDISGVDLRTFEQTQGLFEQKLYSMTTVQKYWYQRLVDGQLVSDNNRYGVGNWTDGVDPWEAGISTDAQQRDYEDFAERLKERYPLCEQQFGIALQKMCKDMRKTRPRINGERVYLRKFPPLAECRKEFEEFVKMDIEWGDDIDLL